MTIRAIDVHAHYAPPGYRAVAARCARADPLFAELNDNVAPGDDAAPIARLDVRLAEMDAAGVDVQAISVNPPSAVPDDAGLARELMCAANDGLLEACARHPDRFVMMAALPLPHVGAALAEIDRLAGRPAVRGVCLGSVSFTYAPDRPEWSPVLERLADLGWPILLHPMRIDPAASDDPFVRAFADHRLMAALQSVTG
ncbi:MAG: amidohydrolase family protein, partial [Actinobacteria bacterium]|nr:amidohydrolase family protein [Actinomycetota bacterium]